jgi:hypothetical protein
MKIRVGIASSLVLAAVIGGCAKVDVYKIGRDGNPIGPDGVRFNRPRPYVAVHEPFIVSARAYLVGGQVTPDGKFILITSSTDNLDGYLRSALGGAIAAQRVLLVTPKADGGGLQSATEGLPALPQGLAADQLPTGTTPEGAETDGGTPTPAGGDGGPRPVERTGQGSFKVVVDNAAAAVQPMRRYFDIAYLPDFEEEFVVQVEERMGNASATLNLGQGWSLQGLDARVDNDAITSRLFALYDESIKIALQLGKTALGVPGVGGLQSGQDAPTAADLPGGTNVTVKVTAVRMVAPGIYPILKPAEGVYVQQNLAALKALMPDLERRILVPVYPMTNVAFNTYDTIVLEAAPAVGDSPLRLGQYIDATGDGGGSGTPGSKPPGSGSGQGALLTDQNEVALLVTRIQNLLNMDDGNHTYTVAISPKLPEGKQGTVTVTSARKADAPANAAPLGRDAISKAIEMATSGKRYSLTLVP